MQAYKKETLNQAETEIDYTAMLLDLLRSKAISGTRRYGFEYEFISARPLNPEIMEELYGFLPTIGFKPDKGAFIHDSGNYISFEPGGQIEYHCPPLTTVENDFRNCLAIIKKTNQAILEELNIEYIATGYIPGRKDSPLCLDSERYINLHKRMPLNGTRGLEMMKGTASIHFHVGIHDLNVIPHLFSSLINISLLDEFKMGEDRRDIWNNTDPGRCGQPFIINDNSTPEQVINEIVNHALKADHIGEDMPFLSTKDLSFDAFMYHMTTIFTDIRLNIKGPSIELRTMDSVPFDQFENKWNKFVSLLDRNENIK
jgi:gamma-glutamylcysteine synthetase